MSKPSAELEIAFHAETLSSRKTGIHVDKWPALIGSIENGKAPPILGASMLESLVGDLRERIAADVAARYRRVPVKET